MATNTVLDKVMRELAALEEPKMREANERRGDDHGVNLTRLRALAKRLKTQHELARWKDGKNLVGRAGWSLTTERVVK